MTETPNDYWANFIEIAERDEGEYSLQAGNPITYENLTDLSSLKNLLEDTKHIFLED